LQRLAGVMPKRAWATFGAFIAVGPATVALIFTMWPGLKPDPADRLAAEMTAVTVDPKVTFAQFLRYLGKRPDADAKAASRFPGAVVYVRIQVHGRKHRNLDLYYSLYRAGSKTRYSAPEVNRAKASYFSADTPDDQWIAQVFVPNPPAFDKVFVRLELYDHDSMLAVADSPRFRFPLPAPP
jgi:hypothetical protein